MKAISIWENNIHRLVCGRMLRCYPVQSPTSLSPFDNKNSDWANVPFTLCSSAFCSLSPSLKQHKLTEPLKVCQIPESGMHFCQPVSVWMEVQSCCSSHKNPRALWLLSCWRRITATERSPYDISPLSPVSALSTLFLPPL